MDILKNRLNYLVISAVLILISLWFILFSKLNLWIDMTGGINMEYSYSNSIDLDKIKSDIEIYSNDFKYEDSNVINSTTVYTVTWEKSVDVVAWFVTWIDDITLDELKNTFRESVLEIMQSQDETITETKYTNIWKSFGDYIKNTAILTLGIAILAITLYVSFAFSWVVSGISVFSFAAITLITLFHDIIISTWLYIFVWNVFSSFQIDTYFITALLTILWYSINDTIVIFDRIRSNLKQFAWKKWKEWKELYEIVNLSIYETIRRSIYTSLTLLFVLFTVYFFGPESIKGFILVMIFWTVVWTYSSIFIASPILYLVNKDKKLTIYKKIVINPDDKIVV